MSVDPAQQTISDNLKAGVTRAQLKYAIGMWVDTLLRFTDWVDEQV